MNEKLVIVPLFGQAPILEKMMVAILDDHLVKSNGCTSPGCWVNAFYCATMSIGVMCPEAQYAVIN